MTYLTLFKIKFFQQTSFYQINFFIILQPNVDGLQFKHGLHPGAFSYHRRFWFFPFFHFINKRFNQLVSEFNCERSKFIAFSLWLSSFRIKLLIWLLFMYELGPNRNSSLYKTMSRKLLFPDEIERQTSFSCHFQLMREMLLIFVNIGIIVI